MTCHIQALLSKTGEFLSENLKVKTQWTKCWQACEEIGTLLYWWWECKMVQPLWKNSKVVPLKIAKVEAIQVSIDRWMDKQNAIYTYTKNHYSALKRKAILTCYNMDESWGHYAKWNKPVTKDKYCMILLWGS